MSRHSICAMSDEEVPSWKQIVVRAAVASGAEVLGWQAGVPGVGAGTGVVVQWLIDSRRGRAEDPLRWVRPVPDPDRDPEPDRSPDPDPDPDPIPNPNPDPNPIPNCILIPNPNP